jgi:uncharacterized protein
MKRMWLAAAAGLAAVAVPAMAQDDPVKAGVEAWERGDYKAAVDRWRRAANDGNADAQFNLGQAYKTGRGVPQDLKQAESWYRKAALQGHEQAESNYGLALFDNGKRAEAVQWLQKGVGRGDARAQYVYGIMLFNGDAVEKDWTRAYALMVRSSQSGLDVASKALAQMDQYVPLDQRQRGLALARQYEQDFNRGSLPQAPVEVADNRPAPRPRPTATAPVRPAPAITRPAPAPVVRDGGWRLQLGAFGEPGNARKLWAQVGSRFAGRQVQYVPAGRLTKVLVGPFASRAEAAGACRGISPCVPVND